MDTMVYSSSVNISCNQRGDGLAATRAMVTTWHLWDYGHSTCVWLNNLGTRPGKPTKSYWKLWFIVDLPIKHCDFP